VNPNVNKGDVVLYQIFIGLIAAAVVFCGGKFGGRYLHEQKAQTVLHGDRPDTPEAKHELSVQLSKGYSDTRAFDEVKGNLTGPELNAAYVEIHWGEKYCIHGAVAGLILGFLLSHEAGRVHARKKASKASMAMTNQRFNNPKR
jgi:hypothetical protein